MSSIPENATKVFSGILFDVYHWPQELFDGSTTTFEMLKRVDASVVIGITPNGQVLLVEDRQPNRETLLTFPGGHLEPGETPLQAAQRELMEETGYHGSEWELWQTFQPGARIEANFHYYVARNITPSDTPKLDQAGEAVTPRLVSMDEFLEGIITGEQIAYDMGAHIMRQLLQGKREELISFLKVSKN